MKDPLLVGEPSVPLPRETLNRDRDCCVEKLTQHPFNRSSKIQKCKLNEGNIDSLSNSGQDYNGCFVR